MSQPPTIAIPDEEWEAMHEKWMQLSVAAASSGVLPIEPGGAASACEPSLLAEHHIVEVSDTTQVLPPLLGPAVAKAESQAAPARMAPIVHGIPLSELPAAHHTGFTFTTATAPLEPFQQKVDRLVGMTEVSTVATDVYLGTSVLHWPSWWCRV